MRPLHLMDLDAATRAVLACAPAQRRALALRLVTQAQAADSYRKRLNALHPQFGSGTLSSATSNYPRATTPQHCDKGYLDCLRIVIDALQPNDAHHGL